MANKHYGNFGDIWKHLALAEILHLEPPLQYWESHAGSVDYVFTHSPERDHGAVYFFNHAQNSGQLKSSQFYQLFRNRFNPDNRVGVYPGSPLIAMEILSKIGVRFVFCDIDGSSIESIARKAIEHNIAADKLKLERGDGLIVINDEAARQNPDDSSNIFALIDPYCIFDEFSDGLNSLHLFWRLTMRGIKTLLWYSYNSTCNYRALWYGLKASARIMKAEPITARVVAGEIAVESYQQKGKADPNIGIIGCGLLCGNLSAGTRSILKDLGGELCRIYGGSVLPGGDSGKLIFRDMNFENQLLKL